ncbi:hypothetical protein BDN72DRAFT_917694 [Pluteus cervinus]|uniref:Uncharacterized protein n=1 Tax=Pluteus cervinus TaxID=181527 RepID=A0ACD3B6L5_9AGAR|nr:hypothetical protein BDN72DRAFT_917694 [Pluteus cervinus]
MNTPPEVDIVIPRVPTPQMPFSRRLNGLGGSADFWGIFVLLDNHSNSAHNRPTKMDPTGISCIIPFCSQVDQTERDLDVIITEYDLADVYGLSPRKRVLIIVKKCVSRL